MKKIQTIGNWIETWKAKKSIKEVSNGWHHETKSWYVLCFNHAFLWNRKIVSRNIRSSHRETAIKMIQQLRKWIARGDEIANFSTVILIDAIIPYTIQSFLTLLTSFKDCINLGTIVSKYPQHDKSKLSKTRKGSSIPYDIFHRLAKILFFAFQNFLNHFLRVFKSLKIFRDAVENELVEPEAFTRGTSDERINNNSSQNSVCFWYLVNKNLYILMIIHSFNNI